MLPRGQPSTQVNRVHEPPCKQFLLMIQTWVELQGFPAHGDVTASFAERSGGSVPVKTVEQMIKTL